MRVVIRGHEICGIIRDMAAEFRRRGDDVTTIAQPHEFYPANYDHHLYDLVPEQLQRRLGATGGDWATKALWHGSKGLFRAAERQITRTIVGDPDLYIHVWGGLPGDDDLLPRLRRRGARIASLFLGSDVRDYSVFFAEFGGEEIPLPPEYYRVPFETKLAILRLHERYAHAIFSVPDQMGLAVRPYYHLQIPLVLDRTRFAISGRDVPVVVHAPSVPAIKRSDLIERTLGQLQAEGVPFEFRSVRNMPHPELLALLTEADVLFDELLVHGPGWLSCEAMASGCAVATRHLRGACERFDPPVVAIDPSNLYEQARRLLTDREWRTELAQKGRAYVEHHNRIEDVVDGLVRRTVAPERYAPDYHPRFLREAYAPPSAAHSAALSRADRVIANEPWYSRQPASRLASAQLMRTNRIPD